MTCVAVRCSDRWLQQFGDKPQQRLVQSVGQAKPGVVRTPSHPVLPDVAFGVAGRSGRRRRPRPAGGANFGLPPYIRHSHARIYRRPEISLTSPAQ